MEKSFDEKLKEGSLREEAIAEWLTKFGYTVLPAYDPKENAKQGPRLFTSFGKLIAPDLFAMRDGVRFWVEVKGKGGCTWHRASQTWQTGINKCHWAHYEKVFEITKCEVFILFAIEGLPTKDMPEGKESPRGLYGETLTFMREHIHHTNDAYGSSGMLYWDLKVLMDRDQLWLGFNDLSRWRDEKCG